MSDQRAEVVTVVGIGADGWAGLTGAARAAIRSAQVLLGSTRQLALLPVDLSGSVGASAAAPLDQERIAWPSPMLPALPGLLDAHGERAVCVLASGDPMFYGVGTTLTRLLGPERVRVLPHPSSVSLACARLGWPADEVEVVSVVGRAVDRLHRSVHPNRRLLVLSADGATPAAVAALLTDRGYGGSALTVLESLGGPDERIRVGTASGWDEPTGALNIVAVHCHADPDTAVRPLVPGLPDDAYEHDGQLTKREIRAVTLARLAPIPGQLLWDVGGGAGSIAIEWLRTHPSCRAVAIEREPARADRIAVNAAALGVPELHVVRGAAPEALAGLEPPDAIFVGGGVTVPGLLDRCWQALRPGGRLVVNAVTLESERVVTDAYDRLGGDLIRLAVQRAAPVGNFTGWRPMLPVTQWTVAKR
ncbi:precorrin-6y C5,15-methyltransferase (decarboxylating) subunit CbiE [Micromonospora sp. NBC_01796]|uniref:precorrin-6y C5,15-methyltransferase (decarboxylating) subunit CbiE n=1 Tax=Micromonospora sp. NBC_01796 TaxID=2975987 RepID=UPI002DD9E8AF|nr:precorrin-6y C5,15-methyltransferase (decarboxylating) subunit CbiE [Micromonospora sp. NBC_01796]WSA85493.1 precorrin-6y C5,15-methyltransferase (decarboxylating) subunit CbiE [Micromonospora sp. NBC_01796]